MPEDTQTVTKKQLALWSTPSMWRGVSGGISDVSDGILAWGRASDADVASNRFEWAERSGLEISDCVTLEQVHGAEILAATSNQRGAGIVDPSTRVPATDGLIARDLGLTLVTSHADCAPIFLYAESAGAIGLVHAGWRGTLAGIASKAVVRMCGEYSLDAQSIQVAVGPTITTVNYEVGDDIAELFTAKFGPSVIVKYGGRPHLDVFASIIIDLMRAGVATARFCPRPPDTYSDIRWSSYRRDGERAGGMLAYFKLI